MAYYTMTQIYNIKNGITPIDTEVGIPGRCECIISSIAANIAHGHITLDTLLQGAPNFTLRSKGVTQPQLNKWVIAALDGLLAKRSIELMNRDNGFSAAVTDDEYFVVAQRCIHPLALYYDTGAI